MPWLTLIFSQFIYLIVIVFLRPLDRHAHSCDGCNGSGGYRHKLADTIAEAEVGVLEARDANKVGQMRVW